MVNHGPVFALARKKLNDDMIKATFSGDKEKLIDLLQKGAVVDYKDTEYSATALTIATRHLHLEVIKTLLSNGATLSNEENEITKSINFSEKLLSNVISKEWEAANIPGDSIEEVMTTLKEAKSSGEIYVLLENSDYNTIATLLMNIRKSKEILGLLENAKILHTFVDEVINTYPGQTSKLMNKHLFKNLYLSMNSILQNITDIPSRMALIRNIHEQLLVQAGVIKEDSNIYDAIQLRKFFLLSEIVNSNLFEINDLKGQIAKVNPAFRISVQATKPAANEQSISSKQNRM